jgi:predicted dehydrogenase
VSGGTGAGAGGAPEVGVVTMGRAVDASQVPEIGVGLVGYSFMGKAHANAYKTIGYMTFPPPLRPRLVSIAGRTEDAVTAAAHRYGFEEAHTNWRDLLTDPRIGLIDSSGPNGLHAEVAVAAAEAGKAVVCEKPLGRNADEAYAMWQRVAATGVPAMCAFNYRFVPALRLAREMIDAGEIGEIRHFRARYLQEWIADPQFPKVWRLDKAAAGSGALGDIGSHAIDLCRFLAGEVEAVMGAARTFVTERPGGPVDVDDAFAATVELAGGGIGTIEASRFALGRKNSLCVEINGSKGTIAFDLERFNELQVYLQGTRPEARAQGFRTVLVSEADHPFWEHWWPHGHVIGWEHTFVHELHHLLGAIRNGTPVGPYGATFEDGYRCAEICDAVLRAAETGVRQRIEYRS